jgi:hypothetical protein
MVDRRGLLIMGESRTPPDRTLAWYLRSQADQDTHRGRMGEDGTGWRGVG